MSDNVLLAGKEIWLVRLFILLRAAVGPVSVENVLAEFDRRRVRGVTDPGVRKVLAALVRKRILRKVKGRYEQFALTKRGRELVIEGAARLPAIFHATDVRRSSKRLEK